VLVATMAPNVALVYGSFFMGDCRRDIDMIKDAFPCSDGLEVASPVTGNNFEFDSLKECKFLVVCTSSMYAFPPDNFGDFAHHLLTAATKHPGCLAGLQHAVYGNGDDTYFSTYMNNPRYIDMLLEKCGSRRFFARGETGEPHAELETEKCRCSAWAPVMWKAAAQATDPKAPAVAWDALWAKQKSEFHSEVTQWGLRELEEKLTRLPAAPAMFSKLSDQNSEKSMGYHAGANANSGTSERANVVQSQPPVADGVLDVQTSAKSGLGKQRQSSLQGVLLPCLCW